MHFVNCGEKGTVMLEMLPRTTELWQTHQMEVFPLCDPDHYHMRIEAEGQKESSLNLTGERTC